jgi:hypothetical protein
MCWAKIAKKSGEAALIAGIVIGVTKFTWATFASVEIEKQIDQKVSPQIDSIRCYGRDISLIKDVLINQFPDAYKSALDKADLKNRR